MKNNIKSTSIPKVSTSIWFVFLLLFSNSVQGQEKGTKVFSEAALQKSKPQKSKRVFVDDQFEEEPVIKTPARWIEQTGYLFLGADLGLAGYSAYDPTVEGGRSGSDIGVRGLLGLYFGKRWIIDSGFGFQFLSNSGTNVAGDTTTVSTKNMYFDLSPRFRFNKNWNLGPEFQYWLGTDVGQNPFNSSTRQPTTVANTSMFLGAQAMFEWMASENKMRVGTRFLTDLNVAQRTVNVIQVFFQFGFPVFGSNQDLEQDEDRPTRRSYGEQINEKDLEKAEAYVPPSDPLPLDAPAPEATPWPDPVSDAPAKPAEKLIITLDVNDLPFEFNSARLPRYQSDRVKEMGRFLGENKNAWKKLIVAGHTDERGANDYDNKLSLARAQTVRQLLGEGGASLTKIKAVGYGKKKPLDRRHNEKAWAKNRRVELIFQGVKDVMIMKQGMQKK